MYLLHYTNLQQLKGEKLLPCRKNLNIWYLKSKRLCSDFNQCVTCIFSPSGICDKTSSNGVKNGAFALAETSWISSFQREKQWMDESLVLEAVKRAQLELDTQIVLIQSKVSQFPYGIPQSDCCYGQGSLSKYGHEGIQWFIWRRSCTSNVTLKHEVLQSWINWSRTRPNSVLGLSLGKTPQRVPYGFHNVTCSCIRRLPSINGVWKVIYRLILWIAVEVSVTLNDDSALLYWNLPLMYDTSIALELKEWDVSRNWRVLYMSRCTPMHLKISVRIFNGVLILAHLT